MLQYLLTLNEFTEIIFDMAFKVDIVKMIKLILLLHDNLQLYFDVYIYIYIYYILLLR